MPSSPPHEVAVVAKCLKLRGTDGRSVLAHDDCQSGQDLLGHHRRQCVVVDHPSAPGLDMVDQFLRAFGDTVVKEAGGMEEKGEREKA